MSTDKARLDIDLIHDFLSRESYWVPGIARAKVEATIAHSLCFAAYADGRQIAYARVITDQVGFAYLADVFVIPERRGSGLSKQLMRFLMDHPALQTLRRFMLATRDAQGLYGQFGFTPLSAPGNWMERYDPGALSRG